jgi:hypothetical protein
MEALLEILVRTASEADRAELAHAVHAVQVQQIAQVEAMKETIVLQWIAIAIAIGLAAGLVYDHWRLSRRVRALESAEVPV